jgi:long-chain acyl-CoA synthetase
MNLVQGYGMSENGPLISVNLPEYHDNHSVGVAVKFTEVRIADRGPDGIGEIQVRSPSLMTGYLDNPAATKEVFTEDGWLRTGDLGRIDRRGFIFITGRSKNLIVTEGGKNVYPEEIEQKFAGAPFVLEVLVVGRKSSTGASGDEIVAVLVPNKDAIEAAHQGRSKDAAFVHELMRGELSRVNRMLAQYMKISDLVVRDEEFEKTSSRKIRRFIYQKQYGLRDGATKA